MPVRRADERERAYPPTYTREYGQDYQGNRHYGGRFVNPVKAAMSLYMFLYLYFLTFFTMLRGAAAAIAAEENAHDQAEHIECGQASRKQADTPQQKENIATFPGGRGSRHKRTENPVLAPD